MKIISKLTAFLTVLAVSLCLLPYKAFASEPYTSAKGAIVIDSLTGEVLYESGSRLKLPMASTTKIMSALIALEQDNLDEEFTVDSEAVKTEGSSMGLREGDVVTLRALVYGMLLPSGNDAANCTAVRIAGSVGGFVEMMNDRAEQMGLKDTHFVTPSGLDDYTDEHYSTAYDMALLTREALKNEDFREICSTKNAQVTFGNPPEKRWLTNTNKLLTSCEGAIGVKTGFTDKARRCLVSACERDGATLICVTLNDPNDWADHAKLYDYCFGKMREQELAYPYDELEVNVVGGESDTAVCRIESAAAVLPDGIFGKYVLECKIYIRPFIYAPAEKGTAVGKIEYYINGILCGQGQIVTEA